MKNLFKRKYKWAFIFIVLLFYISISISSISAYVPLPTIGPITSFIPIPSLIIIKPLDDIYTIEKNTTLNFFDVLTNDPSGTRLISIFALDPPNHGTATIHTRTFGAPPYLITINTGVDYTPDTNYVGTDDFSYFASYNSTNYIVKVTVNIVPDNLAPIAVEDIYTVSSGGPRTLIVTENDYDPDGDAILIPDPGNDIVQPLNGTAVLTVIDSNIMYTPNEGFTGNDVFSYRISDGTLYSDWVEVHVVVLAGNKPPIGVDDTYTTDYNSFLNVTVESGLLINDSDPDGDPIHVSVINQPTSGGVVIINPSTPDNGSFIFFPTGTSVELVSFTYEVSDGDLTDIATIVVSITEPVAPSPSPTPTPTATATPTPTPTATPTPTPTPTPTVTPTPTPTPTSTPIPTPTAMPTLTPTIRVTPTPSATSFIITTTQSESPTPAAEGPIVSPSEKPTDDPSQPIPTIYLIVIIIGGVIIILVLIMLLLKIKK